MNTMETQLPEKVVLRRIQELDPEIDERVVSAVFTEEGGWKVLAESDNGNVRLLWVPAQAVIPRVGDRLRIYGHHHLRGLDINNQSIFYALPPLWDADLLASVFDQASR